MKAVVENSNVIPDLLQEISVLNRESIDDIADLVKTKLMTSFILETLRL